MGERLSSQRDPEKVGTGAVFVKGYSTERKLQPKAEPGYPGQLVLVVDCPRVRGL